LPVRQNWPSGPTTPVTQRLPAITRDWFGLFRFRSPLLAESRLLSLPVGNEMFHFPTFPPHALCVQAWVTGHDSCRVSPFGNPRINARSAAPRGLSQPPTSFFGSWCQGIHRAPLLTWPQRCSRPLCSSQGTGGHRGSSSRTHLCGTPFDDRGGQTMQTFSADGKCPEGDHSAPSGLNSVPTPVTVPARGSGDPKVAVLTRRDPFCTN
jgi:hypothetical protein